MLGVAYPQKGICYAYEAPLPNAIVLNIDFKINVLCILRHPFLKIDV